MCLIVDTNLVHRVFEGATDPDLSRLHACIFGSATPRVTIVYGGRLRREYVTSPKLRRLLATLDQAGRARGMPDSTVDTEEASVKAGGLCVSDDEHVVALARLTGTRLVCTQDRDLERDLKNRKLVTPAAKIYKRDRAHYRLLGPACRQARSNDSGILLAAPVG